MKMSMSVQHGYETADGRPANLDEKIRSAQASNRDSPSTSAGIVSAQVMDNVRGPSTSFGSPPPPRMANIMPGPSGSAAAELPVAKRARTNFCEEDKENDPSNSIQLSQSSPLMSLEPSTNAGGQSDSLTGAQLFYLVKNQQFIEAKRIEAQNTAADMVAKLVNKYTKE